jgi:serine phosphatase RsbU (regulator of sigma subunit)
MAGHRTLSMLFAQAPQPDTSTVILVLLLLSVVSLFTWMMLRSSASNKAGVPAPSTAHDAMAKLLASPGGLDDLIVELQRALRRALPADELLLGWVDGKLVRSILHDRERQTLPNRTYEVPSAEIPLGPKRFGEGKPILVSGEDGAHRLIVRLQPEGRREFVILLRRDHDLFTPGEAEQFDLLAQAVSAALTRLQLKSEVADRATQLVLLGEISRRLITLRPLEQRWSDVVPLLSQAFEFAEVEIYEQVDGHLVRSVSHQADEVADSSNPPAIVEQALAERIPIIRPQEGTTATPEAQTEMAIPLTVERRMLGVLRLARTGGRAFNEEEIGLAEMLAGQLAIAALEARHFAEQQEYTWYNTVLLEITRHAAQPGDPESALRAVLQLTTMLAGANWTLLLQPTEGTESLLVSASSGLARVAADQLEGTAVLASDLGLTPPYQESDEPFGIPLPADLASALGDERCLGLLLSDGFQLLGVLLIGGPEPAGPRRALLAGIGHQISLRIENNRLLDDLATRRSFERELETARSIQRSFLPDTFPTLPGWQVGATWLAARQVGGDFFDFIPLAEGNDGPRWGVVIADVADKGVPAALFMALCRTLLRSVAIAHDDPAEVMTRLNQLILADTRADLFVSLFYGIWQPTLGRVDFANGGHNPPIVVDPDGSWRSVERHGMVLGVSAKANYRTHQIDLPPQATFVLYTDGVTEAMNRQGEYFGMDHLSQLITGAKHQSAQEVAETINGAVLSFCGSAEPPDDLTTVVLKHSPIQERPASREGE